MGGCVGEESMQRRAEREGKGKGTVVRWSSVGGSVSVAVPADEPTNRVMHAQRCGWCEWVGGRAAGGVSVGCGWALKTKQKKLSAVTPLSSKLAQNRRLQCEEKR